MKKSKAKEVKKILLDTIKETLKQDLKASTSDIIRGSKKLDKYIDKQAAKLVKDLAKKFSLRKLVVKADKPAIDDEAFSDTPAPKEVEPASKISGAVASVTSSDLTSPVQAADSAISKNSKKVRAVK